MSNGQSNWSVSTLVRNFDAYPKLVGFEDFQTKTISGALVSVAAFTLMALLFLYEFYDFLTPKITEDISVDFSRQHSVSIHLTIVFPSISCNHLSLDVEDDSGYHQSNLKMNINKIPFPQSELHSDISADLKSEDRKTSNTDDSEMAVQCGSCYGAETPTRKCCNTCSEVMENYEERKWSYNLDMFEQCRESNSKGSQLNVGGCNMTGVLSVNRVAGNFHISPGSSMDVAMMHMHVMKDIDVKTVDMSHTIHQLSFEMPVEGQPGPLDAYTHKAEKGPQSISYYIKVVPTVYEKLDGSSFSAYQFSVTQKSKDYNQDGRGGDMPGVSFHYEFSPMMVKYTEEKRSLGHFLTGLCAIIGGVYTVASLIDSIIFRCGDAFRRKLELGKTG